MEYKGKITAQLLDQEFHSSKIRVEIIEKTVYTFPNYDDHCIAHGQALCIPCARNPGDCGNPDIGTPSCEHYANTGMHWDTCPNRIR